MAEHQSGVDERPTPSMLGALIQAVLQAQVEALRSQEAGVREGSNPEAVHQMRVATRRLRAALRVFRDALSVPSDELRSELAWLADHLGAVRDLDVQFDAIAGMAGELRVEATALQPIQQLLRDRRGAAHASLVAALDEPRYASLVAALCDAVEQPREQWPELGRAPAADGLPELIGGRYRRLRKAARGLSSDSEIGKLHRARIRAKQLRYTLEFASDVYGKAVKKLIRRTVNVQDLLGGIHDAAILSKRLRDLARESDALPAESVFALGQLALSSAQHGDALRSDIKKTLRKVTRRRWRTLRRTLDDGVSDDVAQSSAAGVP